MILELVCEESYIIYSFYLNNHDQWKKNGAILTNLFKSNSIFKNITIRRNSKVFMSYKLGLQKELLTIAHLVEHPLKKIDFAPWLKLTQEACVPISFVIESSRIKVYLFLYQLAKALESWYIDLLLVIL